MSISDNDWDEMLKIAKLQQQEFYELLPEWTKYTIDECKYLRQNIGYALFGPPSENEENKNVYIEDKKIEENRQIKDITETLCYKANAEQIINIVYEQVYTHGKGCIDANSIYYGVIYNISFRTKNNVTEVSNSKEEKVTDSEIEDKIQIYSTPIFKIRYLDKTLKEEQTWYIDRNGRVYKTWIDYIKNNTLPQCTMVLPKDGFYHPDPNYEITEQYSTVWLEILDSPACSIQATILKHGDIASTVAGICGVTLGIASIFTPIGPVVMGATIASSISGVWATGRSVQNLMDRNSHKQSIGLTNKDSFCSWLSIIGSAVGLISNSGNIILTKLVKNGNDISNVAKVAYNTLVLSNLGINGFGIGYQAYCMYQKYQEEDQIHMLDVISLSAHILFFGNAVINLQFAEDLIRSTQGKILDEYRSTLRSKHLRRQFNRTKRNAAANNTDIISENAEVIRYINRKIDLRLKNNVGSIPTQRNTFYFENGKLIICGVRLLDPMRFIEILIKNDQFSNEKKFLFKNEENNDSKDMFFILKDLLLDLLKNVFLDDNNREKYESEFDNILNDIKCMNNAPNIFILIFEISLTLITQSEFCSEYLSNAVHFIWCYIKESLIQFSSELLGNNKQIQKKVCEILTVLFEHIEETIKELSPAFKKYILEYVKKNL
ncbi:uncharacterized protein LOC100864565 [Apis florea]|uniref:uncharacterized protein LOC100864565 n=1 Tax=Apis florea TaxID=7463 RepID=UPI000629029C|nr:uncharacterized protein LOC100864565 [Apis florea]